MKEVVFNNKFIEEVARLSEIDTPFMLTDLSIAQHNCRQFHKQLPNVDLFYAVKALSADEIVTALNPHVSGFDVASIGEIHKLLEYGISVKKLHFTNPVKSPQSIAEAYRLGIESFTVQSKAEIDKLAKFAPQCIVYVRIKVDDAHSMVPLSQKFGANPSEVIGLLKYAKQQGLQPNGLSFHVGSQLLDAGAWNAAIKSTNTLFSKAQEAGIALTTINIGGGFPAQYFTTDTPLIETAKQIKQALKSAPDNVRYLAEPGRSIIANSTVIVSEIIGVEQRDGHKWLFIDTGLFQSFLGAIRYDDFPYLPVSLSHWGAASQPLDSYVITGPSCDSQDVIARDIKLPVDIKVGDRLIFPNCGAYTTVYGSTFNGFSLPKHYFVKDGI